MERNPPTPLRPRVLAAARARRVPGRGYPPVEPAGALACFHSQMATLRDLLAGVPATGWDRHVAPYGWTVHGLVGHLVGVERYTGSVLGLWPFEPSCDEHDHVGLTVPFVEGTTGTDPAVTAATWRRLADRVVGCAESLGPGAADRPVTFHGLPCTIRTMLIIRAFELWTHADDVRRALGRPLAPPAPAALATMADLSLHSLFPILSFLAPHQSSRSARVVLTGPGGGVWRLGAQVDEPDVRLVVDIVDWCHVAARRAEVDEIELTMIGDADLARDLLAAARILAA